MRCGNCNREIAEDTSCPYCGFDNAPSMTGNQKKNSGKKIKTSGTGFGNSKVLMQIVLLGVIMVVIVFGGMSFFNFLGSASKGSGNQVSAGQNNSEEGNPVNGDETAETPVQTITVSEYKVIKADVTWQEAAELCYADGGNLAVITSEEEFDEICQLAEKSGLDYIWAGASLDNCSKWEDPDCWITGEEWTFSKWYPGEPSYTDSSDGAKEAYLCLWKAKKDGKDIGWTMNDQRNDLIGAFPYVSGKIGYICEYTRTQEVSAKQSVEQTQADTDDYIIADSNSRTITEDELDKMTAEEIRIARNEIYARHGRRFQSEDLQSYFDSKSWYKGTIDSNSFDESVLNRYEKANAKFMLEYEKAKGYL